jgi:polyisoprenoid-binding protein YceI
LVCAQKYTVEKSTVTFFSDAAIEDIKADNAASSSIFNIETGEIAFSIPIKDFEFAKDLMKQHFNEKYMDTEKFPKSTFAGIISGYDPSASGEQKSTAKGKLFIHGVTQQVELPGTLEFTGDKIIARSKFMVKLKDYKVKIPQLLWQNIAEEVEVTIEFTFKPMQ